MAWAFRVAYTLAKTIDVTSGFRARSSTFTNPTDPAFDRGLADFDARHRLVLSPVWQIPSGKNWNAFEKEISGGMGGLHDYLFSVGKPVHNLLRKWSQRIRGRTRTARCHWPNPGLQGSATGSDL
jgi:hypothetical protein